MSVEFKWDTAIFNELVQSCEFCSEKPYILKYMPREGKIMEAGCGLGRFVMYLSKKGYDIVGIELSQATVDAVSRTAPGLDVRQADVTNLPFPSNSISGIMSLGVVEHFIEGPNKPLAEMRRVLKPGCYAVITATTFNHLRKIKYFLGLGIMNERNWLNPKRWNPVRKIFDRKPLNRLNPPANLPYSEKASASEKTFYSYFFTKQEFEAEVRRAGFKIVESVPAQIIDGIHHELFKGLVNYDEVKFNPNLIGKFMNSLFSLVPFFHNHMHLCVVTK